MRSANVSAVILTRNEEATIGRCIESLRWTGEVVVVDSGSSDGTVETAARAGARVVEHRVNPFHIAQQRNWALDHGALREEWVLFLDADEVATAALREAVARALGQVADDVVGFRLRPRTIFMGKWLKHCSQFPTWHDRLIRHGRCRFQGTVWESFEETGRIECIAEPYLHYPFEKGISAWIERHDRYSSFWAAKVHEARRRGGGQWRGLLSPDPRRRRRSLESLTYRVLWLSPPARFLHLYVWKRGFLDGRAGLVYCRMMAMYQRMIYLKVVELELRNTGRSL